MNSSSAEVEGLVNLFNSILNTRNYNMITQYIETTDEQILMEVMKIFKKTRKWYQKLYQETPNDVIRRKQWESTDIRYMLIDDLYREFIHRTYPDWPL
jgi:hypothetical protein